MARKQLPPPPPVLSPRQRQVMEARGRGKSIKEVALLLNLSTGTVKNHLDRVHKKLRVHSTLEALAVMAAAA